MENVARSVRAGLGVFLLVSTACAGSTEPSGVRTERRPALLYFYSDSTRMALPDSAHRWQPVTVTITSYGGGCITQGETDVAVGDLLAVIRPYRYEAVGPVACTAELRIFRHVATVQFAQLGLATVRVIGEQRPGDGPRAVQRVIAVVP